MILKKAASSKTLDIAVISYILNSPAAKTEFAKAKPVKELSRRRLKLAISPSIVSKDKKTYRKSVPKVPKTVPKTIPPPPPARPAQVVVDTVTAFYEEHDAHPASHNAVIRTMTPVMRHRLKARRMRGGAASSGLIKTLTVGLYFVAWYALNVVYNSKWMDLLRPCTFLIIFADHTLPPSREQESFECLASTTDGWNHPIWSWCSLLWSSMATWASSIS